MILGTPAGSLHTCPEARCKLSLHLDPACRALEKKKNEQKKKRRKKRKKSLLPLKPLNAAAHRRWMDGRMIPAFTMAAQALHLHLA